MPCTDEHRPRSTRRRGSPGRSGLARPLDASPADRGRCRPWPSPRRRRPATSANGPVVPNPVIEQTTSAGLIARRCVVPEAASLRPSRPAVLDERRRHRVPGGVPRRRRPGRSTSRSMLDLPRLSNAYGRVAHPGSPSAGSTRITSAPKSARIIVASDPARPWVKSSTRRPSQTPRVAASPIAGPKPPTALRHARRTEACRGRPRSAT